MKTYNILMLLRKMRIGGGERHVLDVSTVSRDLGHKVVVASEKGDLLEELESKGIKHYQCPFGERRRSLVSLIKSAIVLRKIIIEEDIDIVHPQGIPFLIAAYLAIKTVKHKKIKIVTTIHMLSSQNIHEYTIGSLILQLLSPYVIFVSEYERQQFLAKRKLDPKKICVIHNGVDSSKFRNIKTVDNLRKKWNLENNYPLLGIIARISHQKGHKYLIKAFSKIVREIPDAKLIIVGDGPLKEEMERLVDNMGMTQNVIFVGFREDIPEMLRLLDIVILPSLWESLPILILETMAANVPVIATNVGGVSEIITNEKTGLLIPPKDTNAIYKAVKKLTLEEDLREKIIENAYKLVKNKFSLPKIVEQIINVYNETSVTSHS